MAAFVPGLRRKKRRGPRGRRRAPSGLRTTLRSRRKPRIPAGLTRFGTRFRRERLVGPFGFTRYRNIQASQLVEQSRTRHTEAYGRGADVAIRFVKNASDVRAFDVLQSHGIGFLLSGGRGGGRGRRRGG